MKTHVVFVAASAAVMLLGGCCCMKCSNPEVPRYSQAGVEKKLIHFGWHEPKTIEQFKAPLEDLESTCPVDGIGIRPTFKLKRNGKTINYTISTALGSPEMLTHEDFEEWIPVLRRLQQTRLKHNFILTASVLFNADWFDDDAWKRTLNNFSTMAWLAKESGFDGICLDIEAYKHSGMPFMFRPELGHTFDETQVQVRKRGAEWIKCLNDNFPGLVLFTFFWTSQCDNLYAATHPEGNYTSTTGLQIAFFNGVYDAAPCNMKIVDGNESKGYQAWRKADYDAAVSDFARFGKAWIDPKNHAKFERITQLGTAIYMDSYVPREKPGSWNLFSKTDNPTALLCQNIENTMNYSQEYAWIWAEQGTFWPKISSKSAKYWNDRLPYAREAIEAGKHPYDTAIKYAGKNVLVNSELKVGESGPSGGPGQISCGIKGWSLYQEPNVKQGKLIPEDGMVRFSGCQSACITQVIRTIKPGECYILSAKARNDSLNSNPSLAYFFRDPKGQGLWSLRRQACFTEKDKDGFQYANIVLTVPDGYDIASMTVTCGAGGAVSDDPADKGIAVGDIQLRKVAYPWNK